MENSTNFEDFEVEKTVLNSEKCVESTEKSLSPVLGSSSLRKIIRGKRTVHKKSKVRLDEKFGNISENQGEIKQTDDEIVKRFHEDSFTLSQTENIFEELEKIEKNREEIYKIFVSSHNKEFSCPINDKTTKYTINEENNTKNKNENNEFSILEKKIENAATNVPKNVNFQTGTGKKFVFSNKDLKKHSKIFDDILNTGEIRKNKFNYLRKHQNSCSESNLNGKNEENFNKNTLNKSKSCSEFDRVKKSPGNFSKDNFNLEKSTFDDEMTFSSNKYIKSVNSELNNSFGGFGKASGTKNTISEDNLTNVEHFFDNTSKNSFCCFKTASGTQINTSRDVLIKAKNIFGEEIMKEFTKNDQLQNEENSKFKDNFGGFKDSSGTKINMSKNALTKAINNFDEEVMKDFTKNAEFQNEDNSKSKDNFGGFKKASGTKINISKDVLTKATNIFGEEIMKDFTKNEEFQNEDNSKSKDNFGGFKKASGSKINISKDVFTKATNIYGEEIMKDLAKNKEFRNDENSKSKDNFGGFKKASGSKINISKDALTKATNIFGEEIMKDLAKNEEFKNKHSSKFKDNFGSFKKASGTKINISKDVLTKATNIFGEELMKDFTKNEEFQNEDNSNFKDNFGSFKKASGSKINISKDLITKAKTIFGEEIMKDFTKNEDFRNEDNFSKKISGSFKKNLKPQITISNNVLTKTNNFFKEDFTKKEDFQTEENILKNNSSGFKKSSGKHIKISREALKKASSIFEEDKIEEKNLQLGKKNSQTQDFASSTLSDTQINFAVDSIMDSIEENEDHELSLKKLFKISKNEDTLKGFDEFEKQSSQIVSQSFKNVSKILERKLKISISNKSCEKIIDLEFLNGKIHQMYTNKPLKRPPNDLVLPPSKKQKCSGDFYHNTRTNSLQNAEEFFKDIQSPHRTVNTSHSIQGTSKKSLFSQNSPSTPAKTKPGDGYCLSAKRSVKKRLGVPFSATISISDDSLSKARGIFNDLSPDKFSTPIRYSRTSGGGRTASPASGFGVDLEKTITPQKKLSSFYDGSESFVLRAPTNGGVYDWLEELEKERKELEEKLRIVTEKQRILTKTTRTTQNDSRKEGMLYASKRSSSKVCLKSFVNGEKPGMVTSENRNLFKILPQNACRVHFRMEKNVASVSTLDGAVIVPNSDNLIGLSEIEHSFNHIPGVVRKLIPKNWIANHFKWIVWKLASYERRFPNRFDGALCIENVIQQLKYRYDREIDKAERSALRKIFEKDDVPQKRIVLCVSNIVRVEDKHELELTDGWYSIRTIIDRLLSEQITKNKIRVGVKLIVSGAELINCDGCHPLEATNSSCLKINYNSTRRAVWHAKLGYQKFFVPFRIDLKSTHSQGGAVGCFKMYIARVYPVKYMEKYDENTKVWRNKKAEERRAQEWQNERRKIIEEIHEKAQTNIVEKKFGNVFSKKTNISEITDPEILFDILENSADPEHLQMNLSSSQKNSLLSYQQNKTMERQQKIEKEINAKIGELPQRNVTAILTLKILDAEEKNLEKFYNFNIWRPTENYLETLKEGEIFSVFNATISDNFGISANSKTKFKKETSDNVKFSKYKRRLTTINDLNKRNTENFEFDTVGLVIRTKIDAVQEIWLSDSTGALLYVKIFGGPKNLLLLDKVKRGRIVAVCNLTLVTSNADFSSGVADHRAVFSIYPQHKHLQQALEHTQNAVSKDLDGFLEKCDKKIEIFESSHKEFHQVWQK